MVEAGGGAVSGPGAPPPWAAGPQPGWHLLHRVLEDVVLATATLRTDLESLLIWGMLARASLSPPLPARPVRVRDLAQLTGIPRETVRRKLLGLQAAGRAERVVHGWVAATAADEAALRRIADTSLDRLRATARELDAATRYSSDSGANTA